MRKEVENLISNVLEHMYVYERHFPSDCDARQRMERLQNEELSVEELHRFSEETEKTLGQIRDMKYVKDAFHVLKASYLVLKATILDRMAISLVDIKDSALSINSSIVELNSYRNIVDIYNPFRFADSRDIRYVDGGDEIESSSGRLLSSLNKVLSNMLGEAIEHLGDANVSS